MKSILYNVLFCFILVFTNGNCFSQIVEVDSTWQKNPYEDPDIPAEFPGGRDSLRRFLRENLKYPASGICITGRCYVRFMIEEDGKVSNVKIIRGCPDCPECNEEAKRLVLSMPKWIPAIFEDKPTKSYFDLPIIFSFQNKD